MATIIGRVRVVLNIETPPLPDIPDAIENYVESLFGDKVSGIEITDSWEGDDRDELFVFLKENLESPKPEYYEATMTADITGDMLLIECLGDHWDARDVQTRCWGVSVGDDGTVDVDGEPVGNLSDGHQEILTRVQALLNEWNP